MIRGRGGRVGWRRRTELEFDGDGKPKRSSEVPEHLTYLIDREKIDVLKRHFDMFDDDQSGLINHDELADFMRSIGHNPVESRLQELIEQFDKDKNGDLSFGEFVQLWYSYLSEAELEKLMIQKAFEFFDSDGSNSIDREEFLEAMTTLGDPLSTKECQEFFSLVDHDSNGVIDFVEFVQFVCNQGPVYNAEAGPEHWTAAEELSSSLRENMMLVKDGSAVVALDSFEPKIAAISDAEKRMGGSGESSPHGTGTLESERANETEHGINNKRGANNRDGPCGGATRGGHGRGDCSARLDSQPSTVVGLRGQWESCRVESDELDSELDGERRTCTTAPTAFPPLVQGEELASVAYSGRSSLQDSESTHRANKVHTVWRGSGSGAELPSHDDIPPLATKHPDIPGVPQEDEIQAEGVQ